MYFLKFGAKIPISIDFVSYFMNYLQNKKAILFFKMALVFEKSNALENYTQYFTVFINHFNAYGLAFLFFT